VSRRTFVILEIAFLLLIPAWIVVTSCAGLPPGPFVDVFVIAYFYLVTGWAFFLSRVVPNVVVDWFSLGLAGACLVGLACGLHFFCAWLHREISSRKAALDPETQPELLPRGSWRVRTTLSIIGIVVLMFVAGIAAVGTVHQFVWLKTRS